MKNALIAVLGFVAIWLIVGKVAPASSDGIASRPATAPTSQKIVTVDIYDPSAVIRLHDQIVAHYMSVVEKIPDDAKSFTREQAEAIRVLGECNVPAEIMPILFKHIALQLDPSYFADAGNCGVSPLRGHRDPMPPCLDAIPKIGAAGKDMFWEAIKSLEEHPEYADLGRHRLPIYHWIFGGFGVTHHLDKLILTHLKDESKDPKVKRAYSILLNEDIIAAKQAATSRAASQPATQPTTR